MVYRHLAWASLALRKEQREDNKVMRVIFGPYKDEATKG
jgi:hypothetical protein